MDMFSISVNNCFYFFTKAEDAKSWDFAVIFSKILTKNINVNHSRILPPTAYHDKIICEPHKNKITYCYSPSSSSVSLACQYVHVYYAHQVYIFNDKNAIMY